MSQNSPGLEPVPIKPTSGGISGTAGLLWVLLVPGCVLTSERVLRAQPSTTPPVQAPTALQSSRPSPSWWANRGRWSFGSQVGFALENDLVDNISHISLVIAQPQIAFIARESQRSLVRRIEMLGEGALGYAVRPGGRLTGGVVLFRLHGKNHGRVVPFFDWGVGVLDTTLYQRAPELSGALQFSPQAGLGIQYFFRPQRAVVFEYRYLHLSNANLQPPNVGFNGSMISVGFRWLRRPRPAGWQTSRHSYGSFRHLFGPD